MKKIEKVWTTYLKRNPDNGQKRAARKLIAEAYLDFDDAYHHGIEINKYESRKINWLLDVFGCHIWDLFEDVHEPKENGNQDVSEAIKYLAKGLSETLGIKVDSAIDYHENKKEDDTNDSEVESPKRYVGKSGMQVFDVIDEFGLGYYEGNALKYLIRYKEKNGIEDLEKCKYYIDRIIERYKG